MITIHKDQIAAILEMVLDTVGAHRKIDSIKAFRAMTGYGLWESKTLVEAEIERRDPVRSCPITRGLELIRVRRVQLDDDAAANASRGY